MANKHATLKALFTDTADAIREKSGDSATIVADTFPDAIRAIPVGGGGAPNGTKWEQIDTKGVAFKDIAFGNGKWIGASSNGVYTSKDGKLWAKSKAPDGSYTNLAYGAGRWIVKGANNFLYSDDGESWSVAASSAYLSKAYYGGGHWVATGYGPSKGIWHSADGSSWAKCTGDLVDIKPTTVLYGNGVWVATNIGGLDKAIGYSQDGVTWKAAPFYAAARVGAYSDGLFVVILDEDSSLYSKDGVNWETGGLSYPSMLSVSAANGKWFAYGSEDYGNNQLYVSADGKTWVGTGNVDIGNAGVFYNSSVFVSSDAKGMSYSIDGESWVEAQAGEQFFVRCSGAEWMALSSRSGELYRSPVWEPPV